MSKSICPYLETIVYESGCPPNISIVLGLHLYNKLIILLRTYIVVSVGMSVTCSKPSFPNTSLLFVFSSLDIKYPTLIKSSLDGITIPLISISDSGVSKPYAILPPKVSNAILSFNLDSVYIKLYSFV